MNNDILNILKKLNVDEATTASTGMQQRSRAAAAKGQDRELVNRFAQSQDLSQGDALKALSGLKSSDVPSSQTNQIPSQVIDAATRLGNKSFDYKSFSKKDLLSKDQQRELSNVIAGLPPVISRSASAIQKGISGVKTPSSPAITALRDRPLTPKLPAASGPASSPEIAKATEKAPRGVATAGDDAAAIARIQARGSPTDVENRAFAQALQKLEKERTADTARELAKFSRQAEKPLSADDLARLSKIDAKSAENVAAVRKKEAEQARQELSKPSTLSPPAKDLDIPADVPIATTKQEPWLGTLDNKPSKSDELADILPTGASSNIEAKPDSTRKAIAKQMGALATAGAAYAAGKPTSTSASSSSAGLPTATGAVSTEPSPEKATTGFGSTKVTGPVKLEPAAAPAAAPAATPTAAPTAAPAAAPAAAIKPSKSTSIPATAVKTPTQGTVSSDDASAILKGISTTQHPRIDDTTRLKAMQFLTPGGVGAPKDAPGININAWPEQLAKKYQSGETGNVVKENLITGTSMKNKELQEFAKLAGLSILNEQMQTTAPVQSTVTNQPKPALNIGARQPTQADLDKLRSMGVMDQVMKSTDPNALNKALGYTGPVSPKPIRAPQDVAPVDSTMPTVKEEEADLEEMMRLAGLEEKLHGDQHKLDVDNDGEIESSDLAKLRTDKVDEADMEEGNAFGHAIRMAKKDGIQPGEKVTVGGETYPVKEDVKLEECDDMGPMANGMHEPQKSHMSITTNMSSEGNKNVTVSAEGEAALELMQLLSLAGMQADQQTSTVYMEEKDSRYHASTTPNEEVLPLEAQLKGGTGEVAGKEKKMTPDGYKHGDNPLSMKKNVEEAKAESRTLSFLKEYEAIVKKKLNETIEQDPQVNDKFGFELGDVLIETVIHSLSDDGIIVEADEWTINHLTKLGLLAEELDEAKYQGREVPLGKPMQGDVKKSKVYVRGPKGNVVKVNFGDPNMKIKKSNPKRRKSFRARHNCDNPGPRWKARYWSCRAW